MFGWWRVGVCLRDCGVFRGWRIYAYFAVCCSVCLCCLVIVVWGLVAIPGCYLAGVACGRVSVCISVSRCFGLVVLMFGFCWL